jgi:signal transduction histidine kinase/Fe-S-cluster-containing hydrogenase component 2
MKKSGQIPLVQTIRERCRVCYTCVRECPAKAIRIFDGQADVITERCIGCGNCVKVCGQDAKMVYDSVPAVEKLLESGAKVAAMVAPSFPAEFAEAECAGWNYRALGGVVRALGFDHIVEVGFGADLVAREYRRLLAANPDKHYIATSCPAIVAYVERYFPALVGSLAPVVSPMIATARVLRHMHGDDLKIVFVGPCIAKKGEAASENVADEIDEVLTFIELRRMAGERDITRNNVEESDFDPPHAGPGALFSISRGLLQAADIREDLASCDVIVADGRASFVEAIKEFNEGCCSPRLLEVLACQGCVMGPGIGNRDPLFRRRGRVSAYVRARLERLDREEWQRQMDRFEVVNLLRAYTADDQRMPDPSEEEVAQIMKRMGKFSGRDELNCGACGYETCREHAIAIFKGLAENEMCLPYTIEKLSETIKNLGDTNEKLEYTRETLVQAEKLATMGQLAAGIAHELNNPLGVVLMYAHMMRDEYGRDTGICEDLEMLVTQADRCKRIVGGLLHFARQNKVTHEETDIRHLVTDCMKLITVPENIVVDINFNENNPMADLDRDQLTQVLNNLIGNACHAMPDGGTLTVTTRDNDDEVQFIVSDSGTGITAENRKKIFDPFFTTKAIGKGTGMGLAVTYGIIKMHKGQIRVDSNTDPAAGPTGATFTVTLPRHRDLSSAGDSLDADEQPIGTAT